MIDGGGRATVEELVLLGYWRHRRMKKITIIIIIIIYFLTCLLTHSMEHSPSSEANRFSATQEIPRILWNPQGSLRHSQCPSTVLIMSQLDPVHTLTSHFLKNHLNIILPSTPGSTHWSLSLRFPHQNPVYASRLTHTRYLPHPSHSSRFYHPKNTG